MVTTSNQGSRIKRLITIEDGTGSLNMVLYDSAAAYSHLQIGKYIAIMDGSVELDTDSSRFVVQEHIDSVMVIIFIPRINFNQNRYFI